MYIYNKTKLSMLACVHVFSCSLNYTPINFRLKRVHEMALLALLFLL